MSNTTSPSPTLVRSRASRTDEGNPGRVTYFPSDRYLRAARRRADLSQRELAARAGVSQACVARIEHSPELAKVEHLAQLLAAAGLHLGVFDSDGTLVEPEDEADAGRRDLGHRRYPAHLDVRSGSDGWWADYWPMYLGQTPAYTFDRKRSTRDWRRRGGWSAPG